jgi:calcineurin-like phosphoesterase family protein
VLDLGDYSYQSRADCWLAVVDSIDGKMKIAIGNHDDVRSSLLCRSVN